MSARGICSEVVEWWSGGVVEWWSGGVVEWWSGGRILNDTLASQPIFFEFRAQTTSISNSATPELL
jgi:hypothetical protein